MKKYLVCLFCGFFIFLSLPSLFAGGSAGKCVTKYPIVLVHGLGFKNENLLGINYWWNIPQALEDEGATVHISNQRTFGSSMDMAADLSVELAELLAAHPEWEKFNLIAHSQGPLACRYLISNLDIPGKGPAKNFIASLTSISGTHRGSPIADILAGVNDIAPSLGIVISEVVNAFANIFYYNEADQNSLEALMGLTTKFTTTVFNPMTPDAAGVYYQSWAGKIKYLDLAAMEDYFINFTWGIIKLMGAGDNDGMVSIDSAKWGKFRGEMTGAWWSDGVNHLEEVDQLLGLTTGFDAPDFYVDVVEELKNKGY